MWSIFSTQNFQTRRRRKKRRPPGPPPGPPRRGPRPRSSRRPPSRGPRGAGGLSGLRASPPAGAGTLGLSVMVSFPFPLEKSGAGRGRPVRLAGFGGAGTARYGAMAAGGAVLALVAVLLRPLAFQVHAHAQELQNRLGHLQPPLELAQRLAAPLDFKQDEEALALAVDAVGERALPPLALVGVGDAAAGAGHALQIGRASCRERVKI